MGPGFDVAQLNAHLHAEIGGFLRNLEAADRSMSETERNVRHLEMVAGEAGRALEQIKVTQRQAFESRAALDTIERSVSSVSHAAMLAADHLHEVKVTEAQATETKVATSGIKRELDEVIVRAEAARVALHRVNGGAGGGAGGAGGGGLLAGALPGGARATPGALAVLAGAALSTMPVLGPASLGLAAGGGALAAGLGGGLATGLLALKGITAEAFKSKEAFDALDTSQQQLVTDLRSLAAGLGTDLKGISETILPHLSQELHAAFSASTTAGITNDVRAFAAATGQVADEWGRFLGGPFGTAFTAMLQHDAQYLVPFNRELMSMADFLTQLLTIGIPFTDWLSQSTDDALAAAAAWAHSADGVQTLTTAFDQGKEGLQTLGNVSGGFLDILAAIYRVTEGGANPALNTLAGFLREIATIIDDNRDELASFFEGGVGAAQDLLGAVDTLRPVIHGLFVGVDKTLELLGGSNAVIDAFALAWVAKWVLAKAGVDLTLRSVLGIGPATVSATAEADAALAGLTLAAREAAAAVGGIGVAAGTAAVETELAMASGAASVETAALAVGSLNLALLALVAAPFIVEVIIHRKEISDAISGAIQGALPFTRSGGDLTYAQFQSYDKSVQRMLVRSGLDPSTLPGAPGMGVGAVPSGADRHGPAANRAPAAGMTYSQQQIRQLLMANGVPADVATNLAIISAHGEDPSGNPAALNDNARTGDYSVGLFQENFLGQMGVDRTKKFAPQFGLAPTTPVKEFVKWLGQHPAAQAKIAYQIFQDQGYGAWTTAAGLGITGGASSAFGTPSPLPSTAAKKGPKSGLDLLPTDIAVALQNAQAAAAGLGGGSGSGGFSDPSKAIAAEKGIISAAQEALDYLERQHATGKQLVNIKREELALTKDIAAANRVIDAAQKQQKQDAIAAQERKILGIGSGGAAATPSVLALRSQATKLAAELSKASGEGLDVDDAQSTLAKLQRVLKFNFIPPDVRIAVANQISSLKQTVSSGMASLLAEAKQSLSDATGAFEAGFGGVLSAADAQFEEHVQATVQSMQILVHGPLGDFMFGGKIKQTPSGAVRQAEEDAHTLMQLQDELKSAQDDLEKATSMGAGHIYDVSTGILTTIPASSDDVATAKKRVSDAEYALRIYNLSKQEQLEQDAATDQLTAAQNSYAKQQRLVETAMDQQVRAIEDGIESGKISSDDGIRQIEKIWADHGVELEGLSFALGGAIYTGLSKGMEPIFDLLRTLVDDLNRVAGLTGGVVNPIEITTYPQLPAHIVNAIPMAGGGYVPPTAGGSLRRLGEAGKGEWVIPEDKMGGGGGGLTLNFNGDVFTLDSGEFARTVTPAIRDELIRLGIQVGGTTKALLGTS